MNTVIYNCFPRTIPLYDFSHNSILWKLVLEEYSAFLFSHAVQFYPHPPTNAEFSSASGEWTSSLTYIQPEVPFLIWINEVLQGNLSIKTVGSEWFSCFVKDFVITKIKKASHFLKAFLRIGLQICVIKSSLRLKINWIRQHYSI